MCQNEVAPTAQEEGGRTGTEGPHPGEQWTVVLPERLSAHGLVPGNALFAASPGNQGCQIW